MTEASDADQLLIERISQGDSQAWEDLIARYEGRLLAFVESRIRNRSTSEDVVQETFIGFLNSLPNYDRRRPLEGYLFSICAYKLTDVLRREGRRPAIAISQTAADSSSSPWQIVSSAARGASSIARSGERRQIEEQAIIESLRNQIQKWQERGDWTKLMCIELLFVVGLGNKEAAEALDLTEQQVANFKFDFLARTKSLIGRQNLNSEIFPELSEEA
ncbi:MAG: RNA polymerase sigma factor [Pirellulaceae bacterium]|nr:RNA polymerase sigma factor [Pirellulaceae bacterium]